MSEARWSRTVDLSFPEPADSLGAVYAALRSTGVGPACWQGKGPARALLVPIAALDHLGSDVSGTSDAGASLAALVLGAVVPAAATAELLAGLASADVPWPHLLACPAGSPTDADAPAAAARLGLTLAPPLAEVALVPGGVRWRLRHLPGPPARPMAP